MKLYCLADSSKYLWDFWLYTGEESERRHKPDEIVMDFVSNVERLQSRKTHVMVVDSYYGSLKLAEWLHAAQWGALLSCKADRPAFLFLSYLHKEMKKEDVYGIDNKNFSAISYYNKAKVNLITNLFDAFPFVKNQFDQNIPKGIYEYRQYLGNVDHFDRWLHLYLQHHRNIKWTQALLNGLLKMAVNNTLIICIEKSLALELKTVTLEVINHLAGKHTTRKQFRSSKLKRTSGGEHFPEEVGRGSCIHCFIEKNIRSSTRFKCTTCKKYLHPKCWINYHSK